MDPDDDMDPDSVLLEDYRAFRERRKKEIEDLWSLLDESDEAPRRRGPALERNTQLGHMNIYHDYIKENSAFEGQKLVLVVFLCVNEFCV